MILISPIITSIVSMVVLFFLTKLTGNKQISQMSMFDYITGITIGSAAAEMAIGGEVFLPATVATVLYGFVAFLISVICNRSIKARRFLDGRALVLYLNGNFFRKNMNRAHVDMGEFLTQCRNAGFFSLSEISCAVMESSRKLSFLERDPDAPQTELSVSVIIDGRVLEDNLKEVNKDAHWLERELKMRGEDIKNIFLATLEGGKLFIYHASEEEKDDHFE